MNNFSSFTSFLRSGVPQGSVLGPLLFLININDINNNISSSIWLFLGDCVVYRTINCQEDHVTIRKDLPLINQRCDHWQTTFKTSKCCVLTFTRKKSVFNCPYSICSAHFPMQLLTNTLVFISVLILPGVCTKANRTLGFLRWNQHHSPSTIWQQAYQTFVRPQLEYASLIWYPH